MLPGYATAQDVHGVAFHHARTGCLRTVQAAHVDEGRVGDQCVQAVVGQAYS